MATTISIVYYILLFTSLGYSIVILCLTVGWFRIKRFDGQLSRPFVAVSVVVAVRNEEKNILKLLTCFINQDYPSSNFEVIVVNDHSEDGTKSIIENFISLNENGNIKIIDSHLEGKKGALSEAFKAASGELILTTDGDCVMGTQWISRIVAFYQSTHTSIILGPVVYQQNKGFFQRFISFDFMSLVASGAGSTSLGKPIMGNAANMAFKKTVLNAYETDTNAKFSSGDDVFLIQDFARKNNTNIQFIRDRESIVYTNPPSSWSDFMRQRTRWASKAKGYQSIWAVGVAMIVFLFNSMLVITMFTGVLINWFIGIFALFILLKTLIDLPLLYEFSGFVNNRKKLVFLPFFEILYPFYIVIAATAGLMFKYRWKDRKGLS